MRLIGMLDSPYVRRVAISLQLLGVRFEHEPLSVFRTFEQFRQINPVVKAPTLVFDDGQMLMDSSLILQYLEALDGHHRSLMPPDSAARRTALQTIGLALAACDKAVQIVYERNVRPAEKLHQPWLDRVQGQLLTAFDGLESRLARQPMAVSSKAMDQAGVSTAVAWHFTHSGFPDILAARDYPLLREFSRQAELLAEFKAAPHGDGTCTAS